MPVNLDAIPDKAPDITRPATVRWIIAGIVIFLIGVGMTLWFWPGDRTGFKFWFTVICLPTLIWGSAFALRRIAYKLERVGTASWNKERDLLIASELTRGQRYVWLVGEHLINALEADGIKTHLAALKRSPILEPVLARDNASVIRHSTLPDRETAADILNSYVTDICGNATNMLVRLPTDMPCYIVFDACDSVADITDQLISGIQYPLRRIRNLSGFSILDYWLDRHHDIPSALLVISAQLYDIPPQDSGESITIMLVSNRQLAVKFLSSVRIHRPQISKDADLPQALNKAMLWGKLPKTAPLRGWITGGKMASEESWSQACATYAPELTAHRNVNIDTVVGYAGTAAPWQSVILAARQCHADEEPQIVAVESAPSYHQLCAVTPAISSGIV
ncbi:hypothetical protein [Yersinia mollaretii]|uniref:hypothetical protein n=1 Tax=Yersinia mollaretii TaxID=33060 RepID=UPI0005E956CD|nr:hypothetical protein [Yersinia mollaretii]MDA5525628.1 hypothetical protein [Yersinia mollaretii]MDR7871729.1 hypothetical protein [Yersinia mollaretii]PHZ29803.1 hypothetical protein CS537_20685 [Yersinia mollaretii]WQC73721.1 hypothetical protein U1Z61_14875 [Yersinia mollaretii]CNE06034.1 Uncharacterised protein [Yersinia mollaretii]